MCIRDLIHHKTSSESYHLPIGINRASLVKSIDELIVKSTSLCGDLSTLVMVSTLWYNFNHFANYYALTLI